MGCTPTDARGGKIRVSGVKIVDNIILIGMPASGKSTAGKALAQALNMDFLDVDRVIEAREGGLLQTVLDRLGIEDFLDAERDAICSLDCRATVVAPGGSCVYRRESVEHMRGMGTVVYLRLSLDEVERRLNNLATRGVALAPGQTIADLYAFRTPLYEQCAHITVTADGQSPAETVERIKQALAARNSAHF